MVKKILVAELEVQLVDLQLEEIDVHEWDIYTKPTSIANFNRMFYSGEGDPNSFTLAPFPTLVNTEGYNQNDLKRQGWCSDSRNYFQLGGRKRSGPDPGEEAMVGVAQYGTSAAPGKRVYKGEYENAYYIGDPTKDTANCKNFWAEEVVMNQMETDLALSREHWTETSKHRIEQELSFLAWGDAKVNFSRDKASLDEEVANLSDSSSYDLLLVLVVTNAHPGIKNNNLNVHFRITS
jgi:hypothetical protein